MTNLPELDLARIRRFATEHVPPDLASLVRIEVEIRGATVTLVERRPPWRSDYGPDWSRVPIAQLRHDRASAQWTLYWSDRNGRWHRYERLGPQSHVDPLLDEIQADPTAIFWG